jgi:diguanylate cyclase (GGDEF)-like protein
VNDTFGHAVGDQVIAAFASQLRTTAGRNGIVGRLGGEEFAVLLPASDLLAARTFAEGVRTGFSQSGRHQLPSGARVTASFGVAAGEEDLSALLQRADEALYQGKRNGRDSVRISYCRPQSPAAATISRYA